VEVTLSHAIKLEAYKQSLFARVIWLTIITAVPSAGHVLSVRLQNHQRWVNEQVDELQEALTQATRGMPTMTAKPKPWSGHATPSDAASSVGSALGTS